MPVPERASNVQNILTRIQSVFSSGSAGGILRKIDQSHLVYKLVLSAVLLAATRIPGAKSSLVRYLAVTSLATLMTRWWLFRACNNPGPSAGEDGDFIVSANHGCKKTGAKGLRCANKCGATPSRTNTTSSTTATTIITPTTSTTSHHSSQTCESQSTMLPLFFVVCTTAYE